MKSERTTPVFATVYLQYKDKLYSYILFRVNMDRDVAEDIVSDVFVKAYQKYETYDSTYALSTWLYTIARNTLIDHYRRGREMIDFETLEMTDTTDPLFRLIDENISLSEVQDAIAMLPEAQRVCINEQFFKGKSGLEIATEIGQSHAAVRKHISRGMVALRQHLLTWFVFMSYQGSIYIL